MSARNFALLIFLISFTITNLVSYFVFDHIPHVQDSIAQVFQAKIFASGRLYARSHPLKEFFDYTHIINNGRWYSQYPPGHPLFLLIGVLLGIPWIVNPLLGSLAIVVTYLLGRRVYDEITGRWSAILILTSPFFIFMSSEFMSHASSMFTFLLFSFLFYKMVHDKRWNYAFGAGIALGLCAIIRPYTALGLFFPFFVYMIILIIKNFDEFLINFLLLNAGFLPFIIILLLYNYFTNGHPLLFGYTVLYGPNHGLGLGKGIWGEPHTLTRGLIDFLISLKALNLHLLGWPLTSFIPILFFFIGAKITRWDLIFFSSFITLCIVYIFYWYHDLCFGPRFLYEALPFLIIISARGISSVPEMVKKMIRSERVLTNRIRNAVYAIVIPFIAYNIFITIPGLIHGQTEYFWEDRRYANSYWGVDVYLKQLVKMKKIRNAIVFVNFDYPQIPFDTLLWFGSGFLNNSPDLKDQIIFARHLGAKDTMLMNYYPERLFYLYRGKLKSGRLIPISKDSFKS